MTTSARISFERMFDRTWRSGHPFRPRRGLFRRIAVPIVLALLLAVIGGYNYITDGKRVQAMAQAYLSQLVGGRAEVGHATLSIFEGLRLDGVRVYATRDDQISLFSAESLRVNYDPRALLKGRVEATDITAIDARLLLSEDVQSGRWNFQAIERPMSVPRKVGENWVLPRLTIRNGTIEYTQMRAGVRIPGSTGTMTIDGSFWPLAGALEGYGFSLQSRGQSTQLGFDVGGTFATAKNELDAHVQNVRFGQDIEVMMPRGMRAWWVRHQLSGAIEFPSIRLTLAPDAPSMNYRLAMKASDLSLAIDPREWAVDSEARLLGMLDHTAALMRITGVSMSPEIFAAPVRLQLGRGEFVFTEDRIQITRLQGELEGNMLQVDGHIDGNQPGAAGELHIGAMGLKLVEPLPLLGTLPQPMRDLMRLVRPQGTGDVRVTYRRPVPGGRPLISGVIDVKEGACQYALFPYPLRKISGQIVFGPAVNYPGELTCQLVGLRCQGPADGPNAERAIFIDASIEPANDDAELHLTLRSDGLQSEPALLRALSPDAQGSLAMLDSTGDGTQPTFKINVRTTTLKTYGPHQPLHTAVEIDLLDGSGSPRFFPYFMRHAQGQLHIDDQGVQVKQLTAEGGPAGGVKVSVEGQIKVLPGHGAAPDLAVTVRNLPVDSELLAALPADHRAHLQKLGLSGNLQVSGRVTTPQGPIGAATQPIDYQFDLSINDGRLQPPGEKFALSIVQAQARLSPVELSIGQFSAERGEARITGHGQLSLVNGGGDCQFDTAVNNLTLDAPLRQLLQPEAQAAWDAVQPVGTLDAQLRVGQTAPATQPGFALMLHPRKLSATVNAVPYRLDEITGTVKVEARQVTLTDLAAQHGPARIVVNGTGQPGGQAWDLKISARDLPVDDDLHKALPESLKALLEKARLQGKLSFDLSQFTYRGPGSVPIEHPPAVTAVAAVASGPAATSAPITGPNIDIAGRVWLKEGKAVLSLPITDIDGTAELSTRVRNGRFNELSCSIDIAALQIAERKAKNFHADLLKPSDRQAIRFDHVQMEIAGGLLAGQVQMSLNDTGADRYALNLALQNADVKELIGPRDRPVGGQVNASLALEGTWNDPASQRGRGDVHVVGENLYEVPVMGLLQITNLSLPIGSPFHEATTRYNIEGQKLTFEKIELRARNMLMEGSGSLDYGKRSVRLTFTTDNPNWPRLPFISDIRHEMLQIHVTGSVQEPKVSANMFNTLSTTVDEVTHASTPRK